LNLQIPLIDLPKLDTTGNSSVNTTSISSTSTSDSNTMTLTAIHIINLATKVVPEYDGTPNELQRFIDAINLRNTSKDQFEDSAIEVIKTKLKGTARITNETTTIAIRDTLKASVKPLSTKLLISKLKNLKQATKSPNDYITQVESLTTALKTAYISDGLSVNLAETYTTQDALEAIQSNSNNEKVNIILEAGNFANVAELSTKFLSVAASNSNENQIHYFQRKYNNFGGSKRFNRGSYHTNNFRGSNFRGGYNNKPSYYNNHGYQNNFRGGYNDRNSFNRGTQNRQVRYVEGELGNSNDRQSNSNVELREM